MSSHWVVGFCASPPRSFTSFSSQPRPEVLHANPCLSDSHNSFEHLANSFPGLIPLSYFSMPHKGLLCSNSIKQTKIHSAMWIGAPWNSSSLTVPLPTALGAVPQGALGQPSIPSSSDAIASCLLLLLLSFFSFLRPHNFSTSCTLSTWSPHLKLSTPHTPSLLSFHFKERSDSYHLLGNLVPLIVISLVSLFSPSVLVESFLSRHRLYRIPQHLPGSLLGLIALKCRWSQGSFQSSFLSLFPTLSLGTHIYPTIVILTTRNQY